MKMKNACKKKRIWYNLSMNIAVTGIGNNSGKTVIVSGLASVMQSLGYKTAV